jgi:hypothetical protein
MAIRCGDVSGIRIGRGLAGGTQMEEEEEMETEDHIETADIISISPLKNNAPSTNTVTDNNDHSPAEGKKVGEKVARKDGEGGASSGGGDIEEVAHIKKVVQIKEEPAGDDEAAERVVAPKGASKEQPSYSSSSSNSYKSPSLSATSTASSASASAAASNVFSSSASKGLGFLLLCNLYTLSSFSTNFICLFFKIYGRHTFTGPW